MGCSGRAAPLTVWELSSPAALGHPALPGTVFPTWRDGNHSREMGSIPRGEVSGQKPGVSDVLCSSFSAIAEG